MPGNKGKRGGKPTYKDVLGVGSLSEGAQQDSTASAASPATNPSPSPSPSPIESGSLRSPIIYTSYSYNSISQYAYCGISAHIPRRDLVIFCVLCSH